MENFSLGLVLISVGWVSGLKVKNRRVQGQVLVTWTSFGIVLNKKFVILCRMLNLIKTNKMLGWLLMHAPFVPSI
jgi:hypothetical protein